MVFKPEVWAAQALTSLRKALVYAGPDVVNHDYEGEIKKVGDTVHIKMLGDVTVRTYNSGDTITYEDLADAEMTLKVDQSDYFAFKVDDIDRAQAGDEMAQRTDAAAYRMAAKVDGYVSGLYTQVQSANVLGTTAVTSGDKSVSPAAQREVEAIAQCDPLSRELFADADRTVEYFESRAPGERLVLLDVGGYFAPTLNALHERFSGTILGVVEDTENGHKRYAELHKHPCPVVSVARSPLKDHEDFLVGQSVVFSTEALMRERGDILHGRPALVIGFGKLGSSIARLLHAKGVQVTVYDIDPIRRTQALSQGFTVGRDRDKALHSAGLVLCATGSISLRSEDFSTLRNGAYVATVTSSEDELDLASLPAVYDRSRDTEHITRYQTTGHYFYLLNGGNAVNFLHGASVGPFIFLVQAEILAAIRMLARSDLTAGMHEVSAADRAVIADTWLTYFNR